MRRGFVEGTALFPERNRLTDASEIQHYDSICKYFTSSKDVAFRSGQRDFYFLMEDANYRIYSFVDKTHQDIADRETYLVFSIVCPKSNIIVGSLKEALQNLKILYKTRNSDNKVQTNMFTNDQVRSAISNLTLSSGNIRSIGNNTVCYFQNESELNLNDYIGNEVYFMQTGSNPELPTHLNLSAQQLTLGQLNQENQKKTQIAGEFRNLLIAKSNFQKANELYNTVSSTLNVNERALFENWKSEEKGKIELVNLKNLIDQYSKNKSKDIAPCETLIAQNRILINGLNETEKSLLSQWRDEVVKNKKQQVNNYLEDIEFEISQAEELEYKNPIIELEAKLNKQIEEKLSALTKSKLKKWREIQTSSDIETEVLKLHTKISNGNRQSILKHQKEWEKTIDGWAQRLQGRSPFDKNTKVKYQYLLEKGWMRKDQPIGKIAVTAFVAIALTGGGYFAAMNWDNWFPKIVEVPKDQAPPTPQPEPEDGNEVVTPTNGEQYTDFEYDGTTYRVEQSLQTEAGSLYKLNNCFYRNFKGNWEKRENKDNSKWIPAPEVDIPVILTKWDEKFKTEQTISKGDSNTDNSENANNNNDGKTNNNNDGKANKNKDGKTNNNNDGKANNNNGGEEDNDKATGVIDDPIYIDAVKKEVKSKNCGKECIENDKKLSRKVKDRLIGIIPK